MSAIQTTPLVGLPRFDGWAQVVVAPDQSWQVVVAVSGPSAGNVGRELANSWLENPFASATELYQRLQQNISEVKNQGCQLQLALRWRESETHQLLATYQGTIILKRDVKVGVVCQSETELRLIQGQTQAEDVLVLLTQQARRFTEELTLKLNQGFDVDSIITSLVSTVHSLPDSAQSALAFVGKSLDAKVALEPDPPLSILVEQQYQATDEINDDHSGAHHWGDSSHSELAISRQGTAISMAEAESPLANLSLPRIETISGPVAEVDESDEVDLPLSSSQFSTPQPSLVSKPNFGKWWQMIRAVPRRLLRTSQTATKLATNWRQSNQRWSPGTLWQPDVYVTHNSPKKIMRWVVPIVILVVIGGGWWWWRSSRDTQQRQEAQVQIAPLLTQLQEASNLVAANPVSARESVQQVVTELEQLNQGWQGRAAGQKVVTAQLLAAQQLLTDISGKAELTQLPIFFDLRFTQPGEGNFIARFAKGTGAAAIFGDPDLRQVVSVNLETKQFVPHQLPSDFAVTDLAAEGNTVWLLGQGEIRRLNRTASAAAQTVVNASDSARTAKLIESYGQLIYVFNPEQRNIFRFSPTDGGNYSAGVGWIRSSQGLDFEAVNSMAIDGDIWLGTRQGEIKRFNTGRPTEFTVRGLSEPFQGALYLTTNEDMANVYVLEPSQHRVVVLSKAGDFLQEVKSDSLASATALVVDEANKRVWPVGGSIVYDIRLESPSN